MKRTPRHPSSSPLVPRKLALLVAAALSGTVYAGPGAPLEPAVAAQLLGMPISFERNDGQYPAEVLFVSRGVKGLLALRAAELAVSPRRDGGGFAEPLRVRLAGGNLAPEVEPAAPLAARSHHYVGREQFTGVPHYGELQVRDVYPGIDMVLHGRDGALEYDFVVAAGADPRHIRLDLRSAERAALDGDGNLRLTRGDETFTQHAPVAFQGEGAQRRAVAASFELVEGADGPEARIALGAYDPSVSLTIDPAIGYSTYVGSSGNDGGTVVRVDARGDLYFTDLGAFGSSGSVTVTKLDPNRNAILYQTTFGGRGTTQAADLAVGGPGGASAYVAGTTNSIDFPGKRDPTQDAFVTVLDPAGVIANRTLIGGSGGDFGTAIALDVGGNVHVAGFTNSLDLPVTVPGMLNRIGASGAFDGMVAKLDPVLTPIYLRYLGGSGDDRVLDLAVDDAMQAIVAGSTSSRIDFPIVNAGAPQSPPPLGGFRGFAAKLTGDGTNLVWSEYVGGESLSASAVAYDPSTGEAVVGGNIRNNSLVPAPASPYRGGVDVYLVRIDAVGNPTFATYLGGSGDDTMGALAVGGGGDIYAVGTTRSIDFPQVRDLPRQGPPIRGTSNAFVARLRGGTPDFSSYLGGSGDDTGISITLGGRADLYVGGFTRSVDFPTHRPYRATLSGFADGFITGINGIPSRGPPGR